MKALKHEAPKIEVLSSIKVFFPPFNNCAKEGLPRMDPEKAKAAHKAVKELSQNGAELHDTVRGTTREIGATKKLWREGNKSRLIKLGVACIVFPDPSPIGEIIGAGLITAGMVQKGIQKRSVYLEDVTKTFKTTLRDIQATKENLRV